MRNKAASSEAVHRLVVLRTLVAALGERATPPWWRTQFLTEVGLRTLGRVFPRTAIRTALESTTIVARADHDKRIGIGRRYHLFRLPTALEHVLIDATTEESFRVEATALVKKQRDDLLCELAKAANSRAAPTAEGPIRLVPAVRLLERSAIEEMAAHYRTSVETGRRVFPYFEEAEECL
jgi:hypothetical protein